MLAGAYRWSSRVFYGGWTLTEPAFVGLWLGMLRPASLYAIDDAYYLGNRHYRDHQHNRRGLFDWEAAALDRWFGRTPVEGGAGIQRIGLIGAGGGRESLALSRLGYEVEGFECNPQLVAFARELLSAEARPASVRELHREQAPTGRYDALIVGWSAYMLMPGRALRVGLLRELRHCVSDGAPLLVSFFTRTGEEARLRRIAAIGSRLRSLLGRQPIELGDDLAPNFVHRFTKAEIVQELEEAGFTVVEFKPQGAGPYDSGYAVARAADNPRIPGS